jgi:hypothetical protein
MSIFVLYFGGWLASLPNVKDWMASARHQSPGITFDAYPYPANTSADGEVAVDAFKAAGDFAKAVKKIESSSADDIYIVGHSSGCAIANAVDAHVKNHDKITLVALDGYCPSEAQLGRPGTQVWVAESRWGKSLHYEDLKRRINEYDLKSRDWVSVNVHHAPPDCTTKLALHFSLVNLSSSDDVVPTIPQGYTNCEANLSFINP